MVPAGIWRGAVALALGVVVFSFFASPARADEGAAVDQIVQILRDKGLIDQQTGDEIIAKQAQSEAKQAAIAKTATPPVGQAAVPGLFEGFIFSGDLRLRDEQFWYGSALGQDGANDNNRFRYRVRVGFTKDVSSWATVGVRMVTDTTDYRSTNVSAGETSNFSYDSIFFDRAYVQFKLPDPGDIGLQTSIWAGKMQNPFIWKWGLDRILWDEDITPEGGAITMAYVPVENVKLFLNTGYFIELQNAAHTDPRVWGIQTGGSVKLPGAVEVGARVSYYNWLALANDANSTGHTGFFAASEALGNLPTAFDPDMRLIESSGYVSFQAISGWPITFWGTWVQNLAANAGVVSGVRVGANDQAYGFGTEVGDAKNWFKVGAAWTHVEANAVPALYTDSDMFDGFTNREGWALYGAREITPSIEARITLWDKEPLKTTDSGAGGGPFNISPAVDRQADRRRLQADLNFKF